MNFNAKKLYNAKVEHLKSRHYRYIDNDEKNVSFLSPKQEAQLLYEAAIMAIEEAYHKKGSVV